MEYSECEEDITSIFGRCVSDECLFGYVITTLEYVTSSLIRSNLIGSTRDRQLRQDRRKERREGIYTWMLHVRLWKLVSSPLLHNTDISVLNDDTISQAFHEFERSLSLKQSEGRNKWRWRIHHPDKTIRLLPRTYHTPRLSLWEERLADVSRRDA